MELRDVRVFLAAVEQPTFRQAAKALGCSQGWVTRTIKKLEGELGPDIALFKRDNSGVQLTAAGHEFHAHALQIMREAEAARRALSPWRDIKAERLRLGHSPSQRELSVAVVAEVLKHAKGLRVIIEEGTASEVQTRVQRGELDVGVIRTSSTPEFVGHLKVGNTIFRVAVHPEHRLAKERALHLQQLEGERFALTRRGRPSREAIEEYFDGWEFVPQVAVEANTMTTVLASVRSSPEFVTVLASPRLPVAATQGLVFIYLYPPSRPQKSFLIWQGGSKEPLSEPGRKFRRAMIELLEPKGDESP